MLNTEGNYWYGAAAASDTQPDSSVKATSGKQGSSMYENDAIPSLPGSANTSDISSGQKVSVSILPPGAKQGDTVELKIIRLDKASGSAWLSSEDTKEGDQEGTDQDESGTGKTGSEPGQPVNTGLLMGPMSNLKNYLARKSVEVQSQI